MGTPDPQRIRACTDYLALVCWEQIAESLLLPLLDAVKKTVLYHKLAGKLSKLIACHRVPVPPELGTRYTPQQAQDKTHYTSENRQ